MKKIVIALVAVAAMTLAIGSVNAEEKYVAGGFEASGHINTGFGFQYLGKDYGDLLAGGEVEGAGGTAALIRDGWTGFEFGDKTQDFGFILDEVELDLTKSFGENIKFRADLSFTDVTIGSHAYNMLEQAYVTANIPVGNGVELLFGRFDAPIGFESVDRNENSTITRSSFFNFGLRPQTLTGMKLYYAFSDAIDWHFYVVNNLEDTMVADFNTDASLLPSFGTRLGYTWGDEGKESTIGLSLAAGPEVKTGTTTVSSKLGHMSFLGDLDWNIWVTDAFAVGGEGIFRMDNADKGMNDAKFFGGLLNLNYAFSDVWDGTLKYSLLKQNTFGLTALPALAGAGTYAPQIGGVKALFQEIGLAGGYQITDGAKFTAEYRLDWTKYSGINKNLSHALLGMFAYSF